MKRYQVYLALAGLLFSGCKESYRDKVRVERHRPLTKTDNRIVIGIESDFLNKPLSEKLKADRKRLTKATSDKSTDIEITTEHYFGSESYAHSISFAYDSSDFKEIRISDKSGRKVYYSTLGMLDGLPPTECYYYHLYIQKMDTSRWYITGQLSANISQFGKVTTRKIELKGIYRAAYWKR